MTKNNSSQSKIITRQHHTILWKYGLVLHHLFIAAAPLFKEVDNVWVVESRHKKEMWEVPRQQVEWHKLLNFVVLNFVANFFFLFAGPLSCGREWGTDGTTR